MAVAPREQADVEVIMATRRGDGADFELLLSTWREDGRFRPTPSGAIYPCHSINAGGAILVFERRVLNWLRPP